MHEQLAREEVVSEDAVLDVGIELEVGRGLRLAGEAAIDVLDQLELTRALGVEEEIVGTQPHRRALSRGAAQATFVENDVKASAVIRRNAEKLDASDRVHILGGSALALPRSDPFDLIFADPPYAPGSGSAVAAAVTKAEWLAPGGWMSFETSRADTVDPGTLIVETTRDVGRARLTLLRRA